MKHPYENEAHGKQGSKDLKSCMKEQFSSLDNKLEEICENLLEKFRKQIKLQFTNELKRQSKRIAEQESDNLKSDFRN